MVDTDMLQPVLAMAGLTALVWVRMYSVRLPEMRRRGISPQSLATSAEKHGRLQDTRASDNFANLFEVPVLFYVAAFAAIMTGVVTPVSLGLAWPFVGLRGVHSLIQCTYNRVVDRFIAYVLSCLAVFGLLAYVALYGLR